MFDTEIVTPERQKYIEDVCRMLWATNFDDTESYIEYYFSNRWRKSITIISDNVSMLELGPYSIKLNKKELLTYYIAGVCTLKEYRKLGYMDSVLRCALRYMYGKGVPFAYLMPASESIYKPYDFSGVYPVKAWSGSLKTLKLNAKFMQCSICAISYEKLTDMEKDSLLKYAESKLSERFSCYVVHDWAYFDELYKETLACSGGIAVFFDRDKSQCMGYFVYLRESYDKIEVAESVFESHMQGEIVRYMETLGCKDISLYETAFWSLKGTKMQKNYLMARIVDLKTFAQYMPSGQELLLDVTDNLIIENSGKWHIFTGENGTVCHLCENNDRTETKKYTKCTIEELGQKYLTGFKYYMNELV